MRDCYVADIGDFVKYGLLQAIKYKKRLGVAWYYCSQPGKSSSTKYLRQRKKWQDLNRKLFDALTKLEKNRSVEQVQQSGIFDDAEFHRRPLDDPGIDRRDWFRGLKDQLASCDLVFADPDNGLYDDTDKSINSRKNYNAKHILLSEANALAEAGQTVVIYHHNNRQAKHLIQIIDWMTRLPDCTLAYYWRRESPRTFFVLNPDRTTITRIQEFAERWKGDPSNPNGWLMRKDLQTFRRVLDSLHRPVATLQSDIQCIRRWTEANSPIQN